MLNNSGSLSASGSVPEGQASVNLMRERTFTPELRSLVDKVTGVKSRPAASAGTLKKIHKLFNRAKNIPGRSDQKPQSAGSSACGDFTEDISRRVAALAKMAAKNGADRLVCVGIDKVGLKEPGILRAKSQLSIVYDRLKKELKGRAFFIRLRSDFFSVFIRHEDIRKLRNSFDKPDFYSELFYKQEIFFEDRFPDDSDILEIVLQL